MRVDIEALVFSAYSLGNDGKNLALQLTCLLGSTS